VATTFIDFAKLRADIVSATVSAINGTLRIGEDRALKDVPVRKIFRGGKQTVRFKTAAEIERDRPLRAKLGLAPEILATPEAVARVRAAGLNPNKGHLRREPIKGLANLETGGPVGRDVEYGFARTIEFPSNDPRRNRFGQTRSERGLVQVRRNRTNDFMPFGEDIRQVKRSETGNSLVDEGAERYLSRRGKYEVQSGRAFFQRTKKFANVSIKAGKVEVTGHTEIPVGPERVGGGLRGTIRVIPASPSMYPVIEGWLVAGDREHDYAKYQELGTRHNPAHPFLRPRLPEWKEELPVQLKRAYGRTGR